MPVHRSASPPPRATVRPGSSDAPEVSWSDDRGRVRFRTLVDGQVTPTDSITAGVSELAAHRPEGAGGD